MQTVILPQRTPTRMMVQTVALSIRNPYLPPLQQMTMLVLRGTHRCRTGFSIRPFTIPSTHTFFFVIVLRSSVDILGDLFPIPVLRLRAADSACHVHFILLIFTARLCCSPISVPTCLFLRGYDKPARSLGRTPCVLATLSVFHRFHFSVYNSMDSSAPF